MKKVVLITISSITIFLLAACKKIEASIEPYDDDLFGFIDLEKDNIKIMQITDLHLTYGFDYLDRKTYKLLDKLVKAELPDLIVITGDIFMSVFAKPILKKFIAHMEKYNIPWTFTFGNHEREYHSIKSIAKYILSFNTTNLVFHPGPELTSDNTHGFSNFKLKLTNQGKPILNLYLLDTKAVRQDGVSSSYFSYDYLSEQQVLWYSENIALDSVYSLAFMHIPLMQFMEYVGDYRGEKTCPQSVDTGFFQAILDNNKKTIGVFVGHDHLNYFAFEKEGVLLAQGVATGYNSYGTMAKGARMITFNYINETEYEFNTYTIFDNEV